MFKTFKEWLEAKSIDKEGFEAKTPQEQGNLQKEYMSYVSTTLKEKSVSKEDIQTIKDSLKALTDLNDEVKIKASIDELTQKVAELKENQNGGGENQKSFTKVIEENTEDIFKAFENGKMHTFTIKADATTASVASNTAALRDNEISPLAVKKFSLYDLFRKVRIGKNNNGSIVYYDWDTATTARAAAMIAEGGTFPESTVAWEQKSITIKKIGDTLPLTEEFRYDTAMFADEVNGFLNMNVRLVEDTQLLSGDGTGNNLKGVYTSAATYTAAASGISDASHYDLAVKVAENITKGKGNKFRPNVILANLTEINKMRLKKDANENYIMPPFVDRNGNIVAGMTVIEENGLANDTMLVGDSRYGKIYEDEAGYSLSTAYVNDDFIKDLETLKARKRMCLLIKDSEAAAWNKVTGVAAALITLAT
ncbi:MAG: hypothetical protein GY740_22480 [Gammaproteobacteria bacterium]|nr:hypothetical protein [Gammaproteobacteria bacterium]